MTSTPRPWTWEKEPNGMTFGIWHDDDTNIGEVLDADDAAVLVQAVNAHDDLLEMTRLLERSLIYEIKKNTTEGDKEGAKLKTITLNLVRAALAKASQS